MDGLVLENEVCMCVNVVGVKKVMGWRRQRANINFMFIYLFLCKKKVKYKNPLNDNKNKQITNKINGK